MFQPLEQFQVKIISFLLSNFSAILFLLIFVWIFVISFICYYSELSLIGLSSIFYNFITFIKNIILQQGCNLHFFLYFPILITLSSFVLFSNIYGLVPYGFTTTSHIFTTLMCALPLFIGITIIGILNNGLNFLNFFVPSGIGNIFLLGFLIIIEIVSYLIRPLSLSIRLFANMLAGHTLLFILMGAVLTIQRFGVLFLVFLPLLIVLGIILLEVGIAFIQAYVFCVLIILYLVDMYSIEGH